LVGILFPHIYNTLFYATPKGRTISEDHMDKNVEDRRMARYTEKCQSFLQRTENWYSKAGYRKEILTTVAYIQSQITNYSPWNG